MAAIGLSDSGVFGADGAAKILPSVPVAFSISAMLGRKTLSSVSGLPSPLSAQRVVPMISFSAALNAAS